MNLKDRLRHLANMDIKERGMYKTTAIAKAARESGGIIIAHNVEAAKHIEKSHGATSRSMDINLEGFSGPFFMDHHATSRMFLRAATKIESLEREVEALRNALKASGDKQQRYVTLANEIVAIEQINSGASNEEG